MTKKKKNNVFKLVDLPRLYKEMVIELGGHTSKRESTQNLVEKQAISTCRELKRVQRQNVFLSNFQ